MASLVLLHGGMLPLGWSSMWERGGGAEHPEHQVSDASIDMTTLSFGAEPEPQPMHPAPAPGNRRRPLSSAGNTAHWSRNTTRNRQPARLSLGHHMRLSSSELNLSCMEIDCPVSWEFITEEDVLRLGLDGLWGDCENELPDDEKWVVVHLWRSYFLYARISMSGSFSENVLCMRHAIIQGALIGVVCDPPRLQLHDAVFELVPRPQSEDEQHRPSLYLPVPLQQSALCMPLTQQTSLLPCDHHLLYANMNRAV